MKDLLKDRLAGAFRPFTVHLSDGRDFNVPHRDFIALSNKVVVIIKENGLPVNISPLHIVSVDDLVADA